MCQQAGVEGVRVRVAEVVALSVVDAEVGEQADGFLVADELGDCAVPMPVAMSTAALISSRSVWLVVALWTNSPSILRKSQGRCFR